MLFELTEISINERIEFTEKLTDKDSSGAEKILMAIDKLETYEKCKVYGRLCKLKALDKITINEFLRLTKIIQDAYLEDLSLVNDFRNEERNEIWEGDYFQIISLGLIFQEPSEQKQIEINHRRSEYEPEIIGGEIKFNYLLSSLGKLLLDHYYTLFPNK